MLFLYLKINKDVIEKVGDSLLLSVLTKEDRDRFYNSYTWRKLRLEILKRDNFECQWCKRKGIVTTKDDTTLIVDHIKELETHPKLALDPNNLRTLCFFHHELRHDRIYKGKKKKNKWEDDEWY